MAMINNSDRVRTRRFLCFQPVVMEPPEESKFGKGFNNQVVAIVDVKQGGGNVMAPTILSSSSSPPLGEDEPLKKNKKKKKKKKKKSKKVSLRKGCAAVAGSGEKGTTTGRIISRIAKVVLFDTKLAKKIMNRKVQHDPSKQYERTEMVLVDSDSKSDRKLQKEEEYAKIEATESSLSGSSSLISSPPFSTSSRSTSSASSLAVSESDNSNSIPLIDRMTSCEPKQRKTKRIAENHNSGLYLLLVSLLALIFFGRLCAILWTATWLYLVPSRRSMEESSRSVKKSPEIQSRDYRKRVVMEGFLERNRK